MSLTESIVEDAALTWFGELGYTAAHGLQIAPGERAAERDSFGDVVLVRRLREAIQRLISAIRDDVSYFQALQAALNKQTTGSRKTPEQLDAAVRQLVSKAIVTEGQVIDVSTAAGLPKPDISILDDRFLAEVRG